MTDNRASFAGGWFILGLLVVLGCAGETQVESKSAQNGQPRSANGSRPKVNPAPKKSGQFEVFNADELTKTDVVPHPFGKITAGRNYVYCSTFQLAWNELIDLLKGPIQLQGSPPLADLLNKRSFLKKDLSPAAYLAKAGSVGEGIADQIRQEMKKKFPQASFGPPERLDPRAFVAFAYLQKQLAFRKAFDRLRQPLAFRSAGGVVEVNSFGIRSFYNASALQVTILHYVNDDDFILQLRTTSKNDRLVLAKVAPAETLAATLEAVQKRIGATLPVVGGSQLRKNESFVVPIIAFRSEKNYSRLCRTIKNPDWTKYFVYAANQWTEFRLDETGARVKSGSKIGIMKSDGSKKPPPFVPRQFVFDKPFLIYLQETTSNQPYFAAWIETAELLETAKIEKPPQG